MPHRNQSATPKVKDIERTLDNTRPFMDDIGETSAEIQVDATEGQSGPARGRLLPLDHWAICN
jgi:hypothetical protein